MRWWRETYGAKAVLILDGLSLRELPWLLQGAKAHGFTTHEVSANASELPGETDEFARALRAVGEPIFGMDASRISMARLLSYLFEVTERFGMETRTELILLQRTMVVVEGVARSLDPHINIWQVAHPVVEAYIAQNVGPRALLRDPANSPLGD